MSKSKQVASPIWDAVRPAQRVTTAFLLWICIAGSPSFAGASAQSESYDLGTATLRLASKNVRAMQVARERFQMVRAFATTHDWPISRMIGTYTDTTLFPVGRSDRMYIYESENSRVFCYERRNGKIQPVYRVRLTDDRRPARGGSARPAHFYTSLLDYLTDEFEMSDESVTIIFSRRVIGSRFAKNDLAKKQEYVKYDYDVPVDTLTVSLLSSQSRDTASRDAEQYDLEADPLTNAGHSHALPRVITNGEQPLYRKYGLPVARKELALFSKARPK